MAQQIPEAGVIGIISSAYNYALNHIEISGDGVVRTLGNGRILQQQAHGLALAVFNANNHQMTWGVLASALLALVDYMAGQGTYRAAAFTVFDGHNEVGSGSIGLY